VCFFPDDEQYNPLLHLTFPVVERDTLKHILLRAHPLRKSPSSPRWPLGYARRNSVPLFPMIRLICPCIPFPVLKSRCRFFRFPYKTNRTVSGGEAGISLQVISLDDFSLRTFFLQEPIPPPSLRSPSRGKKPRTLRDPTCSHGTCYVLSIGQRLKERVWRTNACVLRPRPPIPRSPFGPRQPCPEDSNNSPWR